MTSVVVKPGEIRALFTDEGMAIIRNFDGSRVRVALINKNRKRNRMRIIHFENDEVYELNWRSVQWRGCD